MANALATLARLRRLDADQARAALGDALVVEMQADRRLAGARRDAEHEAEQAPADAAHPLAGAYAAWLPAAARAIAAAEAARREAEKNSHAAMRALTGRKAALEAVETIEAERERARKRIIARKTQSGLDELGHRLR